MYQLNLASRSSINECTVDGHFASITLVGCDIIRFFATTEQCATTMILALNN
jgi:hypothetical protein